MTDPFAAKAEPAKEAVNAGHPLLDKLDEVAAEAEKLGTPAHLVEDAQGGHTDPGSPGHALGHHKAFLSHLATARMKLQQLLFAEGQHPHNP